MKSSCVRARSLCPILVLALARLAAPTECLAFEAKSDDGPVFLVELAYGGLFELVNIPADSLQLLLQVECPRLLFPFARRVVADATRDGGFPPLMIDPIDFLTLYRRRVQAGAEAAQA